MKKKSIKIFLFLKITVILVYFCFFTGKIWIGEKQSLGKDGVETPIEAPALEEKEITKKSTILDDLLNLPPLVLDDKKNIGKYLALAESVKQQIEDRMKILEEKSQYLEEMNVVLEDKIKKIDEERKFILSTIQKEKEIQKDRRDELLPLYEKMQPQKAALVFSEMDKDLVVDLFRNLKKKQITQILENMNPKKSLEITEYYARVGSLKELDLLKEMNRSWEETFGKCKND
jgi:flagellar motility protein MotE (MotC chaperone)